MKHSTLNTILSFPLALLISCSRCPSGTNTTDPSCPNFQTTVGSSTTSTVPQCYNQSTGQYTICPYVTSTSGYNPSTGLCYDSAGQSYSPVNGSCSTTSTTSTTSTVSYYNPTTSLCYDSYGQSYSPTNGQCLGNTSTSTSTQYGNYNYGYNYNYNYNYGSTGACFDLYTGICRTSGGQAYYPYSGQWCGNSSGTTPMCHQYSMQTTYCPYGNCSSSEYAVGYIYYDVGTGMCRTSTGKWYWPLNGGC